MPPPRPALLSDRLSHANRHHKYGTPPLPPRPHSRGYHGDGHETPPSPPSPVPVNQWRETREDGRTELHGPPECPPLGPRAGRQPPERSSRDASGLSPSRWRSREAGAGLRRRSEEHTSELQTIMR